MDIKSIFESAKRIALPELFKEYLLMAKALNGEGATTITTKINSFMSKMDKVIQPDDVTKGTNTAEER